MATGLVSFGLFVSLSSYLWNVGVALLVSGIMPLVYFFCLDEPRLIEQCGSYCKECGYDLQGLAEHRCPECGTGFG